MANQRLIHLMQNTLILLPFYITFGIVLLGTGICIYVCPRTIITKTCENTTKMEYKSITSMEYSNCTSNLGTDNTITCHYLLEKSPTTKCSCVLPFDVIEDVKGEVFILYELNAFNQSINQGPYYFHSRDDNQLSGNLTEHPSEACEPFAYDDQKRPIAPCGAIADTMFNDTIQIFQVDYLPLISTGLILDHEKKGFRNPPPQDNLKTAFSNFSKPKSWTKHIWQLDESNPANNGFQNEPFIAWMRTDWSVKPLERLNRSQEGYKEGLPKGAYNFRIGYNYPKSVYDGPRTAILALAYQSNVESCTESSALKPSPMNMAFGILLMIIGIVKLIIVIASLILYKISNASQNQEVTRKNSLQPGPSEKSIENIAPVNNKEQKVQVNGNNKEVDAEEKPILEGKGDPPKGENLETTQELRPLSTNKDDDYL